MRFSQTPDLSSMRRVGLVALLLWLVAATLMLVHSGDKVAGALGDTDDALRLVLVRDLLHGRGWWDQLVTRLDPPHGAYMHWSRLIDGALAGAMWLVGRAVPSAQAELIVRFAWPLMWIFPAVLAALVVARNLGARSAVLIGAALMAVELQLYRQFLPGRVDHHNVQITLAMAGLALATSRELRPRAAAVAGIIAGLGLAVGLEALAVHALVGASIALRLALDRTQARSAAAYGAALALSATGLFALQTPPWRWGLPFCDALGVNLVAPLVIAGLGLALIALLAERMGERMGSAWRWGLIGGVGALAAAAWLGLDPACVRGPFGAVPARERLFWLDRIQELQPWTATFAHQRPMALHALATMVMSLAAALFLWARNRRGAGEILALAALAAACVAAVRAERMEDYSFWIGLPVLAAGFSYAAQRWLGDRMVPTVAVATLLSPLFVGSALAMHVDIRPHSDTETGVGTKCTETTSFARLARLPPGVVFADIDLGSYILANTPHAALIAPYHRMNAVILAAHDAANAPSERAEAAVRALGADYVVDCPAWSWAGPGWIGGLRAGQTPAWLTRLSPPGDSLQIWRVTPRH